MKTIKQNLFPLSLMLSIPLISIFYVILNKAGDKVNNLVTFIDLHTPLIKIFVVPYLFWYPFIFLTMVYLCVKDRELYYKTLLTYLLGLIVCYLTYVVFQTTVPRPTLTGDDIFTKLLAYVYSSDQPYNAFPSIHVLTSFLMMKAISESKAKNVINQLLIHSNAFLIILSTLFIKQHVILDAVSGILVAEVLFLLVNVYYEADRFLLWQKQRNSLLPYTRKQASRSYVINSQVRER